MSISCIVWHLWLVSKQRRVTVVYDTSFKFKSVNAGQLLSKTTVCQQPHTCEYFGKDGSRSETPFIARQIKGCSPMGRFDGD